MSIFWIHASNSKRFFQSILKIARECRIPGHDDPKINKSILVKDWLQGNNCSSWLLILDNADDYEIFFSPPKSKINELDSTTGDTESKLGGYIPECAHGSILVTTRNKKAAVKLTRNRGLIEVEQMTPTEASQLVISKLEGDNLDHNQVGLLTTHLENLPLALAQAAAFIRENTISIEAYLQMLSKSDVHLTELLSQSFEEVGRDSEIPNAVVSTWILSFEQIREQCPLASEMLSLMSYFDRQRIPKKFLQYRYGAGANHSNRQASTDLEQENALGVLKAFSFVITGKEDKTVNIHRLVQLSMRKWLVVEEIQDTWAAEALLILLNYFPNGTHENREICNEYLPHAYSILSYRLPPSPNTTIARVYLLQRISCLRLGEGQWGIAAELLVEAYHLGKKEFGEEHPSTLTSIGNLALTYKSQGRLKEAEELGVQLVEIRKRVLGEEHPDTLTSINNLAFTLQVQGRTAEAIPLMEACVQAGKKVLGPQHPHFQSFSKNLSNWRLKTTS